MAVIWVDIDDDIKKAFQILCIQNGETMAAATERLVSAYVEKQKIKKGA